VLSHLGWNAKPIGRLGGDTAGALVVADMRDGVSTLMICALPQPLAHPSSWSDFAATPPAFRFIPSVSTAQVVAHDSHAFNQSDQARLPIFLKKLKYLKSCSWIVFQGVPCY